jgi:hypothetical protein
MRYAVRLGCLLKENCKSRSHRDRWSVDADTPWAMKVNLVSLNVEPSRNEQGQQVAEFLNKDQFVVHLG